MNDRWREPCESITTEVAQTAANEKNATESTKEVEPVLTSIINYEEIAQASNNSDSTSRKAKSSRRK